MLFTWLGIAGLEFTLNHQVLLVDPCLTRIPRWKLFAGKLQPDREQLARLLPQGDHLLVTHAHYDHLLDVPALALQTGAEVYGSHNACQLCRLEAVPAAQLHCIQAGDRLTLGVFHVTVIPARHRRLPFFTPGRLPPGLKPPFTARQYRLDECFSFHIQADDLSILVDAGSPPESLEKVDVLFLHPFHSEDYYRRLFARVLPGLVIPNHWDDFWLSLDQPLKPSLLPPRLAFPPLRRLNISQFANSIKQIDPHISVFIPQRLQAYDLSKLL
jgi:L-ascorbate metabolism protein UlaG (beta-lactamase superfamily)